MAVQYHIKNMVCPRCIMAVEELLTKLQIRSEQVELGKVSLKQSLSAAELLAFRSNLQNLGFELLDSKSNQLINGVKALIIASVHHQDADSKVKLSERLSAELAMDYSNISKLFSATEGISIERYAALQRIEKIKELLIYDEMSLAEIAEHLGLSSAAYVSSFFKKETGISPRDFKRDQPKRRSLDEI